jgi:predicted nuclease of predicted toxin-antitoxin system
MKLLLDQNLSHKLVDQLIITFPGSAHVRDLGLSTSSDSDVWDYARANGFTIVSKDNDFQQRALLYGQPPKVIWIRLGNATTAAVLGILQSRSEDIASFGADPMASVLALS